MSRASKNQVVTPQARARRRRRTEAVVVKEGTWRLVQKMPEVQRVTVLRPIGKEEGRDRAQVVQEMPVVVQM